MKTDKKDIVLVSSPPGWFRTLPIGLGFLAAYLRKHGFSTAVYDMSTDIMDHVHQEEFKYLWGLKAKNIWLDPKVIKLFIEKYDHEIQECVDYILAFQSRIVGFSLIQSKQLITLELARRIKTADPSITIIAGGPACFYAGDCSDLEKSGLFDIFVIGEGEETLRELLEALTQKRTLDGIKGIRTKVSGYLNYQPRPPIEDLNLIPFPEYPELDLAWYDANPVPLFWSRGCPGNCSFCEISNVWPSYRTRSAESIYAELRHYIRKGQSYFAVFDSIMNGSPEVLETLCDMIIQAGDKIRWDGNVVSSARMNAGIYKKMHLAGCHAVYFGLESGSPYILRKMRKIFKVSEAERNIRLAHDAGMAVSLNFITGFPGETEMHFNQTVDFIKRNKRYIDRVDFITECQVARGTDLFRHPERYGIVIPEKWDGYKWYSLDGESTIELRQDKTARLGRLISALGIETNVDFNLDDGNANIRASVVDNMNLTALAHLKQYVKRILGVGSPRESKRSGVDNQPSL